MSPEDFVALVYSVVGLLDVGLMVSGIFIVPEQWMEFGYSHGGCMINGCDQTGLKHIHVFYVGG